MAGKRRSGLANDRRAYGCNVCYTSMPTPTILVYNTTQGSSVVWGGVTFTLDTNLQNFSYSATTSYLPENTTNNLNPVSQVPSYLNLIGVTIGNSVTIIGNKLFSLCTALTSITIPNSVTSIGIDTFYSCSALTSITIPNSVINIGNYAFNNSGLTSITIPNSVTSIDRVFYYCAALTSITIPNSVISIGTQAFYNCDSLTSITIPNSVTSIGVNAFLSSGLTTVTIANGQLGITSPTANPPGVSFFGVNVATIP